MKWVKIEDNKTPAWNGKDAEGKFALQAGAEIVGKYVGKKEGLGPRKNGTLFMLRKEDGEEVGVWSSTILANKLSTLVEGEDVKIVYLGDVQGKIAGNAPYHNYEVFHSGADEKIPIIEEGEINIADVPF